MKKANVLMWLATMVLGSVITAAQAQQPHAQQDRPEVLLFMSSHTSQPKGELLLELAADNSFVLTKYSTKGKSEEEIRADWSKAELILLDGINPALSKFMFEKYQPYLGDYPDVPVISLGDSSNAAMNQGLMETQRSTIAEYFRHAGRQNYDNMMTYIDGVFANSESQLAGVAKPLPVPNVGLYHYDFDGLITDQEDRFFNWFDAKSGSTSIAIGIHRSVIDYEQRQVVDGLIARIEESGAKAFGFFFEGNDESLTYPELLKNANDETRPDVIINYRSLHYAAKRRAEFEALGVPVIHALNYSEGTEAEFEQDHAGVSPSLTPFFLVMPEDTGSIDPVIIAAQKDGRKVVMQHQLDALAQRAVNHGKLRHISNQDKKVAAFIWNYPPGEKNIGAAFLDVPTSIENIARAMKDSGYNVKSRESEELIEQAGMLLRPYYRQEDASGLIDKGLADWLPLASYLEWFDALPETVTAPIVERWGRPEESAMLANHSGQQAFVIPRMDLGNMVVMPQGVRGEDAKSHASLYHSTKTPINHSYLALYLYARKEFGANAFIHLGTHGSQEWLTGKERGLSVFDAPNLAIGNLPVFYPYIIDNVGEAMQAKRRGRATMISHLTPGFAKAGLYSEVADLQELLNNYLVLEEGQTKQNTLDKATEMAEKLNILKDLELSREHLEQDFDGQISRVQDHLNELAQQSQPLGVHIFGELPKTSHQLSTIIQMLGEDFAALAGKFEQANNMQVAEENRFDENGVTNIEALQGYQLLDALLVKGTAPEVPENLQGDVELADKYWNNFQSIAEISNLMLALNGGYIPIGHGGDPIRNPDAAPTGKNLVGFNPSKVPSKEAYEAGVALMDQTIADYVEKHGKYPEKLAFSLWSLETMRHQGALEAQILHALGLKPKWSPQGNVIDTEVIPYSELKRPRIDVVISATGLYRDAFPNVMLWMAKAIDKIAQLKEDNNFVYRHTAALKASLIETGKTEEDAEYLSSIRIFSNETGNYGTGLAATSLASDTWEDDSKLANLYLNRMGFAFGKDESRWSENVTDDGLYSQVLSGTDGVIFSRSTNLYALMTNDDPFQYFGGIGLAVRHLDGETPEMYVSNLRRKDNVKAQTMQDFLNQEMRSRYFHPRWIEAMQDSGYAGATAILDRMNNMWGWEVMTPEAVRDDQWQEFFEVYVEDKYNLEMKEFFEQHNAHAMAQILERMLEAVRKDYWKADEETLRTMVEEYTDLANRYDVATDNDKFTDFVNTTAAGFGLAPIIPVPVDVAPQAAPASSQAPTEQVSGQKLTEQSKANTEFTTNYYLLYLIGVIFLLGFVSNLIPTRQASPA